MYLWLHYKAFIFSIQITNVFCHYLLQSLWPTELTRNSKWLMKKASEKILIFPVLRFIFFLLLLTAWDLSESSFEIYGKYMQLIPYKFPTNFPLVPNQMLWLFFMWTVTVQTHYLVPQNIQIMIIFPQNKIIIKPVTSTFLSHSFFFLSIDNSILTRTVIPFLGISPIFQDF